MDVQLVSLNSVKRWATAICIHGVIYLWFISHASTHVEDSRVYNLECTKVSQTICSYLFLLLAPTAEWAPKRKHGTQWNLPSVVVSNLAFIIQWYFTTSVLNMAVLRTYIVTKEHQ
jgi:hypothetical protein